MEMKRRLKKVDANFISLVGKGANNKIIIFKSANITGGLQYEKQVSIKKIDEDQHLVYGIVYSPDEVDLQGDLASADVIKDMAYNFMKNARTNNVDQQHNFIGDEGFVAESWLTKQGDTIFPSEKVGSWAVGIKVEKEETWQLVKKGEITGLSLAGLAAVEEVSKPDVNGQESNGFFEKIKKYLPFKRNINPVVNHATLDEYISALEKSIDDILSDDSIADIKSAIMGNLTGFTEMIKGICISKPGRTISTKNLEKLKNALSVLQDLINQTDSEQKNGNNFEEGNNNIQKNSNAGNTGRNGENEMTTAELIKTVEDGIKPLNEKLEALEQVNEEISARLEAVEKSTPGSRQAIHKGQGCKNQIPIWTE
jgi:hypothetical protein